MNKVKSDVAVEPISGNGKEVKQIQPAIDAIKKQLDEQIARFNRKAELIANRERFQATRNELAGYLAEQGSDYDDTLDSSSLRIQLGDSRKYRGDQQISIANNLIVREFIEFATRKIDAKILDIESEIMG
jgi:hypothetical protein